MDLTTIVVETTGMTELITAQEYARVECSIGQQAYFQGYNSIDSEYEWLFVCFNDAFMMHLSIVCIVIQPTFQFYEYLLKYTCTY